MLEQFLHYDEQLLIYLNNLGSLRYDAFWLLVTRIWFWIPLYLFITILFFKALSYPKFYVAILGYLLSFGISFGLAQWIKVAVGRLRPSHYTKISEQIRVLHDATHFSFVSGHSATSMAIVVYVVCWFTHKNKWIFLLFLWPLLFAYSRIYVGVHYPLDILVGYFLGAIVGVAVFYGIKYLISQNKPSTTQ
ncbi:undecaprenyl-diphosphatase [Mesonia hippocampi]|uniref:Undecaprenyl-diphosphatase n=1 Tax=Mesonia hippocampi TaxID=1628250 RepID=A0A840EKT9_9FLAO|nr:phosphatase PAP2 family protein [Mesonia hippocampi]MBB4118989.1 undecaprenyl-diphosphatase [Mesonia hippocampi]